MEMDPRKQKGLEIAATMRLRRTGSIWKVPSQTNRGTIWAVDLSGTVPSCSCPDHEASQLACKHIHAVAYASKREPFPEPTPELLDEIDTPLRATYPQNWPKYHAAQVNEKRRLTELLRALCDGIEQPPQGRGRPRLPLSDAVFSAVIKVYTTRSGRRAACDLQECEISGLVANAPHYNSVFNTFGDPKITPILKTLIEQSACPLKTIETDFAVDSSGFATRSYDRWFDQKYGRIRSANRWVKVHAMVGVKTNIVASIEVTESDVHDYPMLEPLLNSTAKRFRVAEVSADKAYTGQTNLEAIVKSGATPYIPFRKNSTGQGSDLWRKLWAFYEFNRQDFLAKYHKRSNVETTFSMIKGKFGAFVRSKTPVAQTNEVLAKVLCHNLCCLVHSIYELGIEPVFWIEPKVEENFFRHVN